MKHHVTESDGGGGVAAIEVERPESSGTLRLVRRVRPESVRPYVALFAQYPHAGIETNARTEADFLKMLSTEIVRLLGAWPESLGDKQATVETWLAHSLDIGCRLRGYKAEDVIESRVLYRGDLRPTDDAIVTIRSDDDVAE